MTARTLIVRFDVDVVPLAIKHRIEPQACINKSGTQRLSLCFRLHAHAPRLLVRVDARTIGRVGRVKCGYVGHERNGRQASAGGHLFRLFTKVSHLGFMYELLLYGHTSDVCHTTQKDNGPAYTESVSQIPPGAFNRSWIEERE